MDKDTHTHTHTHLQGALDRDALRRVPPQIITHQTLAELLRTSENRDLMLPPSIPDISYITLIDHLISADARRHKSRIHKYELIKVYGIFIIIFLALF